MRPTHQREPSRPRRPLAVAPPLALGLALLFGATPAFGWGFLGHRVSALLAEGLLTPRARDAIRAILDPGETLADASVWPDEHRREMPETAPWHYVNVPITEEKYDSKFCRAQKGGCVVGKIPEFLATLEDPSSTREQKRLALRFLVHCVQDMHQPVHVGHRDDRGGNDLQLQFFGEGSNLHRVWDSGLLGRVERDQTKTLERLRPAFTAEFVRENMGGTVESWADESLALARKAYDDPTTGGQLKPGAKLGDAYQAIHAPVADRRLLQASARLAKLLNDALDQPTR